MAVSKNFVVKNGLEVGTNVIVADATDLHVGLGTTAPAQTLDVRGDVRFSDGDATSFFDVAGISTFRKDINIGVGGTAFHVDVDTGYVGINSAIPRYNLDVRAGAGDTLAASFDGVVFAPNISITGGGSFTNLEVTGITTTGDLYVSGVSTVGTAATMYGTFAVSSLTDNRIPIIGAGSTIEDDANLVFDGTTLDVGVDLDVDGRTELDTTNISETLNVAGITTLASSGGITTTGGDLYVESDLYVKDDVTFDEATGRNIDITGVATAATLGVSGIATASGLDVYGNVTVSGLSTFTGISTFGNNAFIGSDFYVGNNAKIVGIVTAASFYGDGSNLTGVVASSGGSIGISSGGTLIGSGVTMIDFGTSNVTVTAPSAGVSTVTNPSGVSIGLAIALGS
tara:strand:+ start:706 stop:1899 length:1194 start_codon:yes stop_codon:yes gene_type:complete